MFKLDSWKIGVMNLSWCIGLGVMRMMLARVASLDGFGKSELELRGLHEVGGKWWGRVESTAGMTLDIVSVKRAGMSSSG